MPLPRMRNGIWKESQRCEEGTSSLLHHARLVGFNGPNITHPYKQTVLGLMDDVSG
ncbi:hypothetical protein [Arthrobacter alkaliphilus]|uniref:hypothetical protein n=1 Tax=Arthrobacter alkaliphilus TaxID=369936 RepID=UPI001F1AE052|nr:hypothetical protein [Arthrobacter alkaliphilus]